MIDKKIINDTSQAVILQFEPWADLLYLLPEEEVMIAIGEGEDKDFEIEKSNGTWYIHLPFAHGYGIIENGEIIEHSDYGSNIIDYSKPLHHKSSLKGSLVLNNATKT